MSSTAVRPSRAKRRAPTACRFCRQRKMKCTNEQPTCRNCELHDKICVYDETVKRPRPSYSRISQLEDENRRLQASLAGLGSPGFANSDNEDSPTRTPMSTDSHERSVSTASPNAVRATPLFDSRRDLGEASTATQSLDTVRQGEVLPAVSNVFISAGGESSYHGPTSTLYNDAAGDRRMVQNVPAISKIPTEWVQRGLMAEAAQQRQLEAINFASKKLNFDGVDPELGMHLLSLHWNRQHHSFLITYRPAFMRDMACGGPYFSKLLLNAIFFGVSKFSSRPEVRRDHNDVRTAGWLFRQRVKTLLGEELDRSNITTIQALLVMASSLFALGDERSAAWLYAGTAFRMIIDLGMHVDAPQLPNYHGLSDEDIEIRRRVFWGAFVVDKLHSLYQGRPVSLQEEETRVPITFLDKYEELEHWAPFAYSVAESYCGSPAYSVSTFTELCKLSVIMNRILNRVYAERSAKRGREKLAEDLKSLHADLAQWRKELPSHLTFDPSDTSSVVPPPHVLSLLAMGNVLLILLHRPFVSDGHLHSKPSSIAVNSFLVCATAATEITQILRAYDRAFSITRAPYLISYATYVSATIHVRIAAQREAGSEAHGCLATCLNVFKGNQETNWAVKRASLVINDLMGRMKVVVGIESGVSELANHPEDGQVTASSNVDNVDSSRVFVANDGDRDEPTPELDIDAIIQSFIREQQNSGAPLSVARGGPTEYHRHGMIDQWSQSPSSSTSYPMNGINGPYPSVDGTYDGANSWNAGGQNTESSVNDMLFGFNSSAVDGIGWELEDSPFTPGRHTYKPR